MSNFKISTRSIIQKADLADKNFSYKFCHKHILPIFVTGRAAFA